MAIELAMIHRSPTLNATTMPIIEQLTAPIVSEEIGANNDSTKAARISVGRFASALRVCSSFLISMWLRTAALKPPILRGVAQYRANAQAYRRA
ncbi:MAG: hypothetical protein HY244_04970 [Rhizobiales bacterium]|nr:hypothetical protein [Hyphomicrobiales bacterium]